MSSNGNSLNDRGLGKTIKRILPDSVFSAIRAVFNKIMILVPYRIKYGVATRLRRTKYPYRVIRDGDVVVQVGAPKDILLAGRSRAVNFLRLVGNGKAVIVEPDETNCSALESFAKRNKLSDRMILRHMGAWSSLGKLVLLSNPEHPATNILKVVQTTRGEDDKEGDYAGSEVDVDTLDNILSAADVSSPRLISITANGAEPEILKGLSKTLASNVPYISLAVTGKGYEKMMSDLNYDLVALDDRGFTFKYRGYDSDVTTAD
jgi:FkbM family methyltransferase